MMVVPSLNSTVEFSPYLGTQPRLHGVKRKGLSGGGATACLNRLGSVCEEVQNPFAECDTRCSRGGCSEPGEKQVLFKTVFASLLYLFLQSLAS